MISIAYGIKKPKTRKIGFILALLLGGCRPPHINDSLNEPNILI